MRKCQAEWSDIARIVVISFVLSVNVKLNLVIFCKDKLGKWIIFCYVDKKKYANQSKNM